MYHHAIVSFWGEAEERKTEKIQCEFAETKMN